MGSADIAFVCGLNFGVGCQNRLRVNPDADETLWPNGIAEVSEMLAQNQFNFLFCFWYSADVNSEIKNSKVLSMQL